jgi:hypothetical protein
VRPLLIPTTTFAASTAQQIDAATALLAPAASLGADARTFIFDTAEALSVVLSFAALAQLRLPVQAVLAPAAALSGVAAHLLSAKATLAPAAAFAGDARTFIFDLSEALSPALALAPVGTSILVAARAALTPRRWW